MKKLFAIYNGDTFIGAMAIETPAPGEVIAKKIQNHLNEFYDGSEWSHVEVSGSILEAA
jgi:hypothetical protein